MCDTFVALGDATPTGAVVFAKNSDREPTEPQGLEFVAAQRHAPDATLFTSFGRVPQAAQTYAVLLSRPYWMWGAEMGVNEHGVVAGNEAVFTRVAAQRRATRVRDAMPWGNGGLLGMDILRLALERSNSAQRAAELAGELIEHYGQCGAGHSELTPDYDSSFLFADPHSAWTLESAGTAWVRKQVTGVYAISNRLRIRDEWQQSSANITAYARDLGLSAGRGRLNFAATFSQPLYSWAAAGMRRQSRAEALLSAASGAVTAQLAWEILRDHGAPRACQRGPVDPHRASICAHASWLPQRRAAQTTASMLVDHGQARANAPVWVTASAAPCTSLFKPLWLDVLAQRGAACLPDFPGARPDASPWWRHERLHSLAKRDFKKFLAEFVPERRALELELLQQAKQAQNLGVGERLEATERAWASCAELEQRLLEKNLRAQMPPAVDAAGT